MTKPFTTPFAVSGERDPIPLTDASNYVNYTEGYTPDYSADPAVNPSAKNVERKKQNTLFHDITEALGDIQKHGFADWDSAFSPYALNAYVRSGTTIYRSAIVNNTSVPGLNNDWQAIGSAAFAEVVQSTGSSTSDVMSQGAVTDGLDAKLNSNKVVQATGTSTTDVMSQKAVTDRLFGTGQGWQYVTASREVNTIYTNNTGKPIFVSWYPGATTGASTVEIRVTDGTYKTRSIIDSGTSSRGTLTTIVPAGSTYEYSADANLSSKGVFWEYR